MEKIEKRLLRTSSGVVLAMLAATAQAQQWFPHSHHALGVHWDTDEQTAQKQFEDWGFRGIKRFGKSRWISTTNCNDARKQASGAAVTEQRGCYYYKDGGPFVAWENNCRVYEFDFERYEGDDHGDGHHHQDCRSKGRGTGR